MGLAVRIRRKHHARTSEQLMHTHVRGAGGGLPAVNVAKGPASDDLKAFEPVCGDRRSRLWVCSRPWVHELLHHVACLSCNVIAMDPQGRPTPYQTGCNPHAQQPAAVDAACQQLMVASHIEHRSLGERSLVTRLTTRGVRVYPGQDTMARQARSLTVTTAVLVTVAESQTLPVPPCLLQLQLLLHDAAITSSACGSPGSMHVPLPLQRTLEPRGRRYQPSERAAHVQGDVTASQPPSIPADPAAHRMFRL